MDSNSTTEAKEDAGKLAKSALEWLSNKQTRSAPSLTSKLTIHFGQFGAGLGNRGLPFSFQAAQIDRPVAVKERDDDRNQEKEKDCRSRLQR